ncbi:MAG: MGMT family protein, partial [Bradymonadaceae bacterium]
SMSPFSLPSGEAKMMSREPRDTVPDYSRYEELSEMTADDLADLRGELEEFQDRVDWLVRQIPRARVATYGQIAMYAGSPRAARAVGNLMRSSRDRGVELPWHRVINARGGISGRGDLARTSEQKRRLRRESVEMANGSCDLETYRWEPDVLFWEDNE